MEVLRLIPPQEASGLADEGLGTSGGKRMHVSEEEGEPAKRPRATGTATKGVRFDQISNPMQLFNTLVGVNDCPLIGSLSAIPNKVVPKLYIDVGLRGPPQLTLTFKWPGSEGSVISFQRWCIDDHDKGGFVIKDLAIEYLKDIPPNHVSNDKEVLDLCPEPLRQDLVCITMQVTSHKSGFFAGQEKWKAHEENRQAAETLNIILKRDKDYEIQIWALTSLKDKNLNQTCFSVLRSLFEQRAPPLLPAHDRDGKDFLTFSKGARLATGGFTKKAKGTPRSKPHKPSTEGQVEWTNMPMPRFGFDLASALSASRHTSDAGGDKTRMGVKSQHTSTPESMALDTQTESPSASAPIAARISPPRPFGKGLRPPSNVPKGFLESSDESDEEDEEDKEDGEV